MTYIQNTENIPELTDDVKVSKEYSFNKTNSNILISDADFERVLFVYNETTKELMYRLGSDYFSGIMFGRELTLDIDTSAMNDDDVLTIIYIKKQGLNLIDLLQKLIQEQKTTNKILNKIYK